MGPDNIHQSNLPSEFHLVFPDPKLEDPRLIKESPAPTYSISKIDNSDSNLPNTIDMYCFIPKRDDLPINNETLFKFLFTEVPNYADRSRLFTQTDVMGDIPFAAKEASRGRYVVATAVDMPLSPAEPQFKIIVDWNRQPDGRAHLEMNLVTSDNMSQVGLTEDGNVGNFGFNCSYFTGTLDIIPEPDGYTIRNQLAFDVTFMGMNSIPNGLVTYLLKNSSKKFLEDMLYAYASILDGHEPPHK